MPTWIWSALTSAMSLATGHWGSLLEPLLWFGAVVLLVMVAVVFLLWVRRRLRAISEGTGGLGLTLTDLRRQRDRGRLTSAEYEKLKEIVIDEAKAGFEKRSASSPDKVLQQECEP